MNKITKIFNNIGFYCSVENDYFIYNSTINSYQFLSNDSIGYYIPYLVRNLNDNYKWEIGVGEVVYYNGSIAIKRIEISSSSNNSNKVNFSNNKNEFYLFINNINFNNSFNNVILKNDHFTLDNITAIYLVDNNEKTIDCVLPDPKKARNVVIDIKALYSQNNIKIRLADGEILTSITDSVRLVCDGKTWYILNVIDNVVNFGSLSNDAQFSAQANPAGNDYSFQYKDGANLVGSELYWSSGNSNKLLLGSDTESSAHSVISTSGNSPTIFNKDLQSSDFIVYGSGIQNRNLFFSYDGKVGINIPSGSRPQTVFHVVNYSCSEISRLENRTNCQPAKFTIFHRPPSITNGTVCSILNLAGRDSNNNSKDYATIYSIASDVTNGFGGVVLSISSGNSPTSLISGDIGNINIGYDSSKRLNIGNNGNVSLSGLNIDIRSSSSSIIGSSNTNISFNNNNRNISFNSNSMSLGTGSIISNGTISANNLTVNNISLPNISPSSLLTIDSSNRVAPVSGILINNNKFVLNGLEPNKLLSTDSNKNVVGLYSLDDYFLTEKDITWNKYSPRSASVCLKQVTFDEPVPSDEFGIGDQVEIQTDTGLIYRNISNIEYVSSEITALTLNQNVTTNSVNNISLLSITKGGYLLIQKYIDGATSDSTSNILSSRPFTDTIFNTNKKDIDFIVYGTDVQPAFKVHANLGSVTRPSGQYYSFATKENTIDPIVINYAGSGLSNSFSSANYDYDVNINQFPAKLSSVGSNGKSSYYGTYDQNGNVREWIESESSKQGTLEKLIQQRCVGGSYLSSKNNLRSLDIIYATGYYNDVGFRIASLSNIVDHPNVSGLNLNFRLVSNTNNIADTGTISINGSNSTFFNLGVVDRNYRIGAYEVTNSDYTKFLNAVATTIGDTNEIFASGLYNSQMSGVLGGINKYSSNVANEYIVKNNMGNKPVNYVNYINSLKYINWLENGAPTGLAPDSVNNIINQGAYEILLDGNNTYNIITNKNRKYFLPSLNEWHKAAYFEYKDSVFISGSPVVSINTDTPHVVATEKVSTSNVSPKRILADLTVSGWLVVDKIIVRDGTIRSSLDGIGFEPDTGDSVDGGTGGGGTGGGGTGGDTGGGGTTAPPVYTVVGENIYWTNSTARPRADGVFGTISPPLPPNGDGTETTADCENEILINSNNLPYWCQENGRLRGPYFY
jgi:hypothetical protein